MWTESLPASKPPEAFWRPITDCPRARPSGGTAAQPGERFRSGPRRAHSRQDKRLRATVGYADALGQDKRAQSDPTARVDPCAGLLVGRGRALAGEPVRPVGVPSQVVEQGAAAQTGVEQRQLLAGRLALQHPGGSRGVRRVPPVVYPGPGSQLQAARTRGAADGAGAGASRGARRRGAGAALYQFRLTKPRAGRAPAAHPLQGRGYPVLVRESGGGTAASRTPARTGHRRSRPGPGNRPRGQRRSSSERSFLRKSGSGIWNRLTDEDGPPSKGLWRLDAVIPNA